MVLGRINEMEKDDQVEFLRWLEHIMIPRLPEKDRKKIRESIKKGGDDMLQYNLDRAFDDERKKGIKEGKKEKEIELTENLIKIDLPVEKIIQVTGLSEKEVMKIKMRLNI